MSAMSDLHTQAVAYCEAVWFAREGVFEDMCHDAFAMTLVSGAGETQHWDKAGYLARVSARDAATGEARYGIHGVDVSGNMGRVHLWVEIPGTRFEDHLGFVWAGGRWSLLTKVCRMVEGAN